MFNRKRNEIKELKAELKATRDLLERNIGYKQDVLGRIRKAESYIPAWDYNLNGLEELLYCKLAIEAHITELRNWVKTYA